MSKMKSKSIVIHPFFFALYPILFLYANNMDSTSLNETFVVMAIVIGFTILSFLLLNFILKDKKKAGIIISLCLLLFFSYGYVHDAIDSIRFAGLNLGRNIYLIFTWGMLFLSGVYFTIMMRKHLHLHHWTHFLNIVASFLIVITLTEISVGLLNRKTGKNVEAYSVGVDLGNSVTFPDIYYIILDGYGSESTLKEIYGYDNHEFINCLTDKGFYVASRSRSNYALTFLSLASSLNMEYINSISNTVGLESKDRTIPNNMIENSKVMRFLKKGGYKFIHFSSGWGATDRNKYADRNIKGGRLNEFTMMLAQTTMLNCYSRLTNFLTDDGRERVLKVFSELPKLQHKIKEPCFFFAHILAPHPPYLFGPNGESITPPDLRMYGDVWKYRQAYLDQLMFVNKKVKVLIERILFEASSTRSSTQPVIILQADHGSASTGGWDQPSERLIKERMGIFNAYYLPKGGKDSLYDSITPVNTFRIIFNRYFNTNYDLIEDRVYFSSYERPYDLRDVTDVLNTK